MKINKILLATQTLSAFFYVFANQAYAQLPTGVPITLTGIGIIITRIGQFMVTISTVLGVIFIIWAGITYMAAGADPTKVKDARQRLLVAIIGVLIVFGVGVIMQTVAGVSTGSFFF